MVDRRRREQEERGLSTSDNGWGENGAVACVSCVEFDVEGARCESASTIAPVIADSETTSESRDRLGLRKQRNSTIV